MVRRLRLGGIRRCLVLATAEVLEMLELRTGPWDDDSMRAADEEIERALAMGRKKSLEAKGKVDAPTVPSPMAAPTLAIPLGHHTSSEATASGDATTSATGSIDTDTIGSGATGSGATGPGATSLGLGIRQAYSTRGDEIGHVCSLREPKDVDHLLDAMRRLHDISSQYVLNVRRLEFQSDASNNGAMGHHRPGEPTGTGASGAMGHHRPGEPTGIGASGAIGHHRPGEPTGIGASGGGGVSGVEQGGGEKPEHGL